MPPLNFYDTKSEAVKVLRERGFTERFEPNQTGLRAIEKGKAYLTSELIIIEYHRFEAASVSDETSLIFAIKTTDDHRGIFSFRYLGSPDMRLIEMVDKIPVQRSEIRD
jgi:hypothetical protein